MRRKITNTFKLILLVGILLNIAGVKAQTEEQRQKIVAHYNLEKLNSMATAFNVNFKLEQEQAMEYARLHNIPIVKEKPNGGIAILQKISDTGVPIYYTTDNRGASITTRTNELYEGGDLNISIAGENMIIGIWDGGMVEGPHELLEERVLQMDGAITYSDHATHVAGTLIGSEVPANGNARGMAYEATAWASDFGNDLAEMIDLAADGLLVSNHSYGYGAEDLPDYYFGYYDSKAAAVDAIAYAAPYYLMVASAGNDRGEGYNAMDNGYDLLTDMGVAKNNLVVAAVNEVNNYTGPESVVMSSFSSWGPPDDGRVKPDISAKGVNTLSSIATGVNNYSYYSGTSMASPNVAGSLILLQQLHYNLNNSFMRSATLRGLAIHTASEAGLYPGPDYRYGWGLLNMEAAARVLLESDFRSDYEENKLVEDGTFTKTVTASGNDPLVVTLVWTDPEGNVLPPTIIDNTTSKLVNDLDVKITDAAGNEFFPWKLDVNNYQVAATTGNNIVDNVEKIEIPQASGQYTITVSHKGNLQSGEQQYSLIVTGIDEGGFAITPQSLETSVCDFEDAELLFNYYTSDNNTDPVNFSVSGLPTGATGTFNPVSATEEGLVVLTITNLDGVASGVYPITITATNSTETRDITIDLEVTQATPLDDVVITFPSDGAQNVFIYPTLIWTEVANVENYQVEVSTDPEFDSVFFSGFPSITSIPIPGLSENTTYYWRVRPRNSCVEGNYTSGSFTTEVLDCGEWYAAADTPITIPAVPAEVTSSITIPADENIIVADVNVFVEIEHSWVADLTLLLTSPSGTTVILVANVCGEGDDIEATFDDTGSAFECASTPPAINGLYEPLVPLNAFIGEDAFGEWTLTVIDGYEQDGGIIQDFGLRFCRSESIGIAENQLKDLTLYPNPAQDFFDLRFSEAEKEVQVNIFDINGRKIISKNYENNSRDFNQRIEVSALATGIYFVEINNAGEKAVQKLIVE